VAKRKKLYAKFGQAAEAGQLFETALSSIMLVLKGHEEDWFDDQKPEDAKLFSDRLDKLMLGQLLGDLRKHLFLPIELEEQFKRALKARNRLTHGFFERHNFRIQTSEGRDIMIEDLETIHTELFRCWRVASGITEALLPLARIG
jgi:hypothetical protein